LFASITLHVGDDGAIAFDAEWSPEAFADLDRGRKIPLNPDATAVARAGCPHSPPSRGQSSVVHLSATVSGKRRYFADVLGEPESLSKG